MNIFFYERKTVMKKFNKPLCLCLVLLMLFTAAAPASAAMLQPGDVNKDGKITAVDARIILRASVGLEKDIDKNRADVDGNGKITAYDARLALRISVGLELAPPEIKEYEPFTPKRKNAQPQKFTLSSESEETMTAEIPISPELLSEHDFDGNTTIQIKLPVSAFTGEKTLTVTEINELPPIFPDDKGSVIFDFKVDGITELNGRAEIRIPLYFHGSTTFGAAYYNEKTRAWEPVDYYIDSDYLYIRTDHLSTYGMFEILNENLTTAILGDYILPQESYRFDIEENAKLLKFSSEKGSAAAQLGDSMASLYSDASLFGCDIGYNTVNAMGFESGFMTQYSQLLSDLGFCFSCYQIARYSFEGKSAKVAGASMQAIGSFWLGRAASAIGTSAMTASMAAIAGLNFSIQSFGEAAQSGRKDIYSDAFNLYYADHGRSAEQWYHELYPIFRDANLSPEEIQKKVNEKIDKYCRQFFTGTDNMTEYVKKAREKFGYTMFGGYSEAIRNELENNLKYELVNGVLKSVFRNISEKMEQRVWEQMDKKMQEFRAFMNQTVTLSFYDSGAKDGSEFAGGKVSFTGDTGKFKDKNNLCCLLDSKGEGSMKFTVCAYVTSGLTPLVTAKTYKTSKTVGFKIKAPVTKIDLKGAKDLTGCWVRTGTVSVRGKNTNTGVYEDTYSAGAGSHSHKAAYIYEPEKTQSCFFTCTCSEPPEKIKGGDTVSLNLTMSISDSNVTDYHFRDSAWAFVEDPGVRMGFAYYNLKFRDPNGDYSVEAWAIGDWGSEPKRILEKTVSYTFAERGYPQSVIAINFDGCGSRTQWIYTFVA